MGEVSIEIDIDKTSIEKIDIDKINIDKSHKPHNGKPIKMIVLSPNNTYIITYSDKDKSIVGWNNDIEEGQLKLDNTVQTVKVSVQELYVTDDKILFYRSSMDGK
jgi:hypothetical protein